MALAADGPRQTNILAARELLKGAVNFSRQEHGVLSDIADLGKPDFDAADAQDQPARRPLPLGMGCRNLTKLEMSICAHMHNSAVGPSAEYLKLGGA